MNTKRKPLRKLIAAQKRVAIAKDVLKQIKSGRYTMKSGAFAVSDLDSLGIGGGRYNQESVRKLRCRVCADGAAIISAIRLFNDIDVPHVDSPHLLEQFFGSRQTRLIELSFERGRGFFRNTHRSDKSAVSFGMCYASPTKRAQAIFTNIIANNGRFVP